MPAGGNQLLPLRTKKPDYLDARYFQISVPVQPGNSGGALVDEHGNVVGVVSAKLDASAALAAEWGIAGKRELRGEELVGRSLLRRPDIGAAGHRSPTLSRIHAGSFGQVERANHG